MSEAASDDINHSERPIPLQHEHQGRARVSPDSLTPLERRRYWSGEWLQPADDPAPDLHEPAVQALLDEIRELIAVREMEAS